MQSINEIQNRLQGMEEERLQERVAGLLEEGKTQVAN